MRRSVSLLIVAATFALLLSGVAAGWLSSGSSHSALPAPTVSRSAGAAPLQSAPSAPATPSGAARLGTASSVQPASGPCSTPGGVPTWQTPNFFSDVAVTFWTPGSPTLSGTNFQTVPCSNVIPTYTNGFWMNVSTNVGISSALVKIWGTGWPNAANAQPDIKGFAPSNPATFSMFLQPPFYRTASFYFNDYRYFWPGSQVYFNLTLATTNATPSTIYSASTQSNHWEAIQWAGGVNNATWGFYVASPYSPTSPGLHVVNFSNIIQVTTSPSVLGTPAYEPNPFQQVQFFLQSQNITGAPAIPIPAAQATITLTGSLTGVFYQNFQVVNHTILQLTHSIGPYPGTRVQVNVTAWLPWEGGGLDFIYSPIYAFNWSAKGGWWNAASGINGYPNPSLVSSPDVTSPLGTSTLSTGTPVNVSIHESIQNVTIGSAAVHFQYSDTHGVTVGTTPMTAIDTNSSYAIIPGLPPNSGLVFSVVAKDIFGNPISSGNFSYTETGPLAVPLTPNYGLFFFEAIDLATGNLVPFLNYTVANDTWSETQQGYTYGFANPVAVSGGSLLPVAFGTYVVTVHAFGQTQRWTGVVAESSPFVVIFYMTSQSLQPTYAAPLPGITIPAIFGLVAVTIASVPIVNWYRERRRKAEAEQRRISL